VDIRVELKDGKATLAVRDYGCGVASERLEAISGGSDSGVGLAGMRERVNELGGSFEVFSEKPGTSIRVTLPIAKADARAAQAMKRSEKIGSAA
jgi:signal transduction histidine kinase